jgi:copper chaperone
METLKFKTNINCGGCIASVTPVLNGLEEIQKWNVDTASPDKILTIEAASPLSAEKVSDALKGKGYQAVRI